MARVVSGRAVLHTRFPNNLGRLRVLRGKTQKAIAEMVGVSRSEYAQWETGAMLPSRGSLARLVEGFGQRGDGAEQDRLYPAWVERVIEQAGG